jgi:hypothetical protein
VEALDSIYYFVYFIYNYAFNLTLLQCLLAGFVKTLLLVFAVTQIGGALFDLPAAASLIFLPRGLFLVMPITYTLS